MSPSKFEITPRSIPTFGLLKARGWERILHDSSARDRELSRQIDTAWHNMSLSWKKYRQDVEEPQFSQQKWKLDFATESYE